MFDITTFILAKQFTTSVVNKQAGKRIDLADYSGKLDQETLDTLNNSISNTLVLDGKLFRLAFSTDLIYKYINTVTDGNTNVISMTELDIDKLSGKFSTKKLIVDQTPVEQLRAEFEEHRDNADIHVTLEDKAYWNNKVSVEVEEDAGADNYKMNLIK